MGRPIQQAEGGVCRVGGIADLDRWRIARMMFGRGWHNPLRRDPRRRAIERTQRRARIIAAVIVFVAIPCALFAGASVRTATMAESLAQSTLTHRVTATLLADAPSEDQAVAAQLSSVTTTARWPTPSGRARTGVVTVLPGAKAGSTVPVWVDRAGAQADPPLTRDQAFWRGVVVTSLVLLATLALVVLALRILRVRLDQRRYAAWASEWSEVEPRWTHRTDR